MSFTWQLSTDQKICYDAQGIPVPCAASGQDAAQPSHRNDGVHRFQVRGDTVFDESTGLYWCRNANPFDFPYTWEEAFDRVDDLNRSALGGRHDWRLPTRRELFSLISHQNINPSLPSAHPFWNVFPSYYWTPNTCQRLPRQAWYIHLGGARVYRGMKNGAYLVWPVAGSRIDKPACQARFQIEGAIAKDRVTGLWWMRRACVGSSRMNWQGALAQPEILNRETVGGRSNWRLPNIRELESLIDLTCHSPALQVDHPFEEVQDGYWSSTTSVYEPRYAWVLYMQDGAVGVGFKKQATFSTWTVSDGEPGPATAT